ncbi:hypothetical protein [Variovorax sp. dw_308]|uniref:hypothetical protein n=1 Tax=Variovorax sp. dw_308 TaxID=2721546 RepID=UPI001C464AFB|nr:hypothetical protein [Variovorax sp. dw_308]
MFQYRIALAQMHRGASEREIARSHCMGRHKLADLHALAEQHGWLDAPGLGQCSLGSQFPHKEPRTANAGSRVKRSSNLVNHILQTADREGLAVRRAFQLDEMDNVSEGRDVSC